jgi:prepilin-type N-terminal cleavage/methylation domain-containing protein
MPTKLPLRNGCNGFTLVEVMIALAILTIALLGVAATTALQGGGIAGTFPFGQAAVTRGYYLSTATMLAQDWLEQVKRVSYKVGDPYNLPSGFTDQSPVPNFPNFNRQVRVVDGPVGNTKAVTVTVTFILPTERGVNSNEGMSLSTLVAARP